MGYCMKPGCEVNLMEPDSYIGETAHIVPFAVGRDMTYENLILLCRNCHKQADDYRAKNPDGLRMQLINWRVEREREIRQIFSNSYKTFEELRNEVKPLLERNGEIFEDYGPDNSSPEVHVLWKKFEPEIIINNNKIELLLDKNKNLLPDHQKQIVSDFRRHAREFLNTRNFGAIVRKNLFPVGLLAIFGLNRIEQRELSDGFDGLTSNDLKFFENWLDNNGIYYEMDKHLRFPKYTLNQKIRVVLCNAYCLSDYDLQEMYLTEGLFVVNMCNWHHDTVSDNAYKFANLFGVKVFPFRQFFAFVHNKIKL